MHIQCGNKVTAAVKSAAAYASYAMAEEMLRKELTANGLNPACIWGTAVTALRKERRAISREPNHYGPSTRMSRRWYH